MDAQRWQKIEDLFHQASELAPDSRAAFLDAACEGDASLRQEVDSLLAADANPRNPVAEWIQQEAGEVLKSAQEQPWIGRRFGPWRVTGILGQGGMGAVFRAERDDQRFDQQVAIKVLRAGMHSAAELTRFERERRILARLDHAHIARLLDGGEVNTGVGGAHLPYLVMEHIEGEPLTVYCSNHQTSIDDRVRLFLQVLDAVGFAHQKLVLHRDLKPDNILVTEDGSVKLLDFGIAKLLEPGDTDAAETSTVLPGMTPEYASPEQVRGELLSVATDVYSLGVILYELLTGRRPFRVKTSDPVETSRIICETEPPAPNVDPDLDTIVAKAMHKEASRRYASVERFAEDLGRYLEGKPVLARRDSFGYRARKFLRRNRWQVAAAALILLSLTGGLAGTMYEARLAQQRVQDLRQLAGQILFEVHDAVITLPGSMKAREVLMKASTEHLDRLSKLAGGDAATLLELASAYERLGALQGGPNAGHAGQFQEGIRSYQRALDLYGQIPAKARTREVLLKVANCWKQLGRVQLLAGEESKGARSLQRSLEIGEPLAEGGQPSPGVIETYSYLGDMKLDLAEPEEALVYYRKSLAAVRKRAEQNSDPKARRAVAIGLVRVGQAQLYLGDVRSAQASYRQGLEVMQEVARAFPDNTQYQRDVLVFLDRVGSSTGHPDYPNLGDSAGAEVVYREALSRAEPLARADARDSRAQRDWAEMYGNLADTIRERKPAEALALYRRSLSIYATLPQEMRDTPTIKRWMAVRERGLSQVLVRTGHVAEARERLKHAVAEIEAFAAADPESPDGKQDLGRTLIAMGQVEIAAGHAADGERALERGMHALEVFFRTHPKDVQARGDLALAYRELARAAAAQRVCSAVEVWWAKSAALWRELAQQQPSANEFATAQLRAEAEVPRCSTISVPALVDSATQRR